MFMLVNAYLNVEDVSQEGRTYSFHLGQSEGVGVLFWRFYSFPIRIASNSPKSVTSFMCIGATRVSKSLTKARVQTIPRRSATICDAANFRWIGCCGNG